MSKIEVDKIDPQSGTDLELGTSGDTITIPAGVTFDSSAATNTLPSTVVTTTGTQTLTNKTIDASQLSGTITPSDNTVSLAKLTATGTKDATTFLRGDNSFQEVPAGGITEVDMWRITANASIGSGAVRYGLTSNWERADTYSFAKIGDGMTESSGIFSFTNTGIYYVEFSAMAYIVSSTMRAVNVDLIYTADNSNYVTVCNQEFNVHNTAGNSTHGCATARYIFDITDVSNQKLKFGVWDQSGAAGTVQGNTDTNFTFVTFMKLGDT